MTVSCVVKVGGAAITDKAQLETLRAEVLATTAAQLAQAVKEDHAPSGLALIVVHGAGSFGHQLAHQAQVHKGGIHSSHDVQLGFSRTRLALSWSATSGCYLGCH